MNFLILSRIPELYSTQRLVQEVANLGHTPHVASPEISSLETETHILIPRIGNYRYEEAMTCLARLELSAPTMTVLNRGPAFHHARHKKLCAGLLKDLPQPLSWDHPLQFPVVVKDCVSSQGEGVFLCTSPSELAECQRLLQGREVLYQEFISECRGRDVRAFVVGNEVKASIERHSQDPETEFRSNLALGGRAYPAILSEAEQKLCVKAVQTLKLDYAGVDFVRSKRGPLLLEVNPCPGFEGVEKISGRNLAKDIVVYAESLHSSHS